LSCDWKSSAGVVSDTDLINTVKSVGEGIASTETLGLLGIDSELSHLENIASIDAQMFLLI